MNSAKFQNTKSTHKNQWHFYTSNEQPKKIIKKIIPFIGSLCCSVSSHIQLFVTPGTAARQASLSSTTSRSSLKLTFTESVMSSNRLILCHPCLLLPSVFPSIRVFSSELAFHIRWPKYWSFSFGTGSSNEHSGLISCRTDLFDLLDSKGLSKVFSSTTIQRHQFFSAQPSLWSNSHIPT